MFRRDLSKLLASLTVVGVLVFAGGISGFSQTDSEAQIIAPKLMTIKSATETGLPIRVITSQQGAFVLIKGLPQAVALSTGRLFDSGIWALKVSELGELKIVGMVNSTEEHGLSLSLKTLDGDILAEAKTALRISPLTDEDNTTVETANGQIETAALAPADKIKPESAPPQRAPFVTEAVPADRAAAVPKPRVVSEADMESILLLMRKGSENMQQGNINVARLFYTRAAEKGWADAAFSLARTYDAVELQKMSAIGVDPEPDQAKKWYKRAVDLGSTTAVAYLERLQ